MSDKLLPCPFCGGAPRIQHLFMADELDEMVDAADSTDDRCERLADLADRIRKLAKREDER